MLNQIVPTATEANFSGLFLKNYLEYIEDFPGIIQEFYFRKDFSQFFFADDIMRILSICRELDIKTNSKNFHNHLNWFLIH